MVKPKDKQEPETRIPGPKTRRSIIPGNFQISRNVNPMRMILDESEGKKQVSEAKQDTDNIQISDTSVGSQTRLVNEPSLDAQTRLDSDLSGDWTESSLGAQTRLDSLTDQRKTSVDLMTSLPDVKGFLRLYFQLIDHLYPQLDPFERAVHETLYRLSWGFGKSSCIISYQRIAERTGMSSKSAQRAAGRLEQKGLVSKSARIIGYQKEQGIEFSVVPPPRLALETRQVRLTRLDSETNNIDINTQIENTQTQADVRVASRFTLEECRRYANHLKATGQGITNPGGYATKIFRSGEADALIEVFLTPLAALDISQCPDCRGTNFIYIDPSNHDRGVRPCRHEHLKAGSL